VRVARSTFLTNAPILIADEEGYFEREGIRIEYMEIPLNSVQALPPLQRGDVDAVAATTSIGLLNAVASGGTFRMVADRGFVDPHADCEATGIIGRGALFKGKKIDASILRGRNVSTNPVGHSGYMVARFLEQYGLTLKDIKLVRLAPNVELQAMHGGTLDIVARNDPYMHALLKEGDIMLGGARTLVPNTNAAVVVYGPRLLVQDRNLGLRFMKGYLRGVRQYNLGHTPRNLDVISRRLGIKPGDLAEMCWPSTRPDGAIDDNTLADYQRWAVTTGHLKEVASASQLIDSTFAVEASRLLDSEARAR
jgi:NitT/TauT family transport system substrate-binding protein